jgi:hypothetical protein
VATTDAINENTRFVVPDHVLPSYASGETVLMNLDNEEYYGLDEVGSRFWALATGGATFGEIIKALLDEYAAEPDELVNDVTALIDDLCNDRLVEIQR